VLQGVGKALAIHTSRNDWRSRTTATGMIDHTEFGL